MLDSLKKFKTLEQDLLPESKKGLWRQRSNIYVRDS